MREQTHRNRIMMMLPCVSAGAYATLPFACAQAIVELPYILIQSVLFSTLAYAMVRLRIRPPAERSAVLIVGRHLSSSCMWPSVDE